MLKQWRKMQMSDYPQRIANSHLSIYDYIDSKNAYLHIPSTELERILSRNLVGYSLSGLALRTRSKVVKQKICNVLGYPVPKSFKKTQPRFPGQNFNVYIQKSLNVQIWNEDINPERRYVFLQVGEDNVITHVRVITGNTLILYDRTGTLTTKYQAIMNSYDESNLFSEYDTDVVVNYIIDPSQPLNNTDPNAHPNRNHLLHISEIYARLLPIIGKSINYLGAVQERNRGAELHKIICSYLGYSIYEDNGLYPDIANQLLEIKLQTSQTIDLGLHSPTDGEAIIEVDGTIFHSEDVRYAIFRGEVDGEKILLKNLYVVSGRDFVRYFPLFKGKNAKIQISLPNNFFNN